MFEKILEQIEKYDVITIHGHVFPDGDCFGSQIGLRNCLRKKYPYKKIFAVGSGLPAYFDLLGRMDAVSDEIIESSLGILLDGNDIGRMELSSKLSKAKAFAKIDHHIDAHTFTEGPQVVDTTCNSCCELITHFIQENNLPIDKSVSNPLFFGTLTDSDRFRFSSDFAMSFRDAAYLCDNGAEPSKLIASLSQVNESSLKVKAYILSHYQISKKGILYYILAQEEIKQLGSSMKECSNSINLLSNVKGHPIIASFVEDQNGLFKLEIRSSNIEIHDVACKYNGGGHALAAGSTVTKDLIQNVLSDLEELL